MLTVSAYAKINLTLEVLGRRADGYHEVATVLQQIDLKDTLSFKSLAEYRGISLDCSHPDLALPPPSPQYEKPPNLVMEAANLLQEVAGSRQGAAISITKRIPIAAGLGGGASDAAATLKALNELWGLGLSLDEMLPLASRLGSDTAFFLYGGTALGEGRGERISPLPTFPPSQVLLFRPPVSVPSRKTESLYASLDPSCFSEGQSTRSMVTSLHQVGEPPPSSFFNAFERIAFATYTGLEEYWQRFLALGADNVHLAGSGPTLFTMVQGKAQGQKLYRSLRREGLEAYLVQTMAKG